MQTMFTQTEEEFRAAHISGVEDKNRRLIKGIFIFILAIGSFLGVLIISNEIHKLRD